MHTFEPLRASYDDYPQMDDLHYIHHGNMIQYVPPESLTDMQDYGYHSADIMTLSASVTNIANAHHCPVDKNGECQAYEDKEDPFENKETFKTKLIKHWNSTDVLQWINSEAKSMKIFCTEINGTKFCKLDGYNLLQMSESDFENCDQKYGKVLYRNLKKIVSDEELQRVIQPTYTNLDTVKKAPVYPKSNVEALNYNTSSSNVTLEKRKYKVKNAKYAAMSKYAACKTMDGSDGEKKKRKGPGRPKLQRRKKKQEKKLGRLWEFIRDLLKDPRCCPSIIRWEDHDNGLFRFVHSDKVAQLWGSKKSNKNMNYEKLSRAMRYYYKSGVLQAVIGRRLVYKFGPSAKNWRVENPNFEN